MSAPCCLSCRLISLLFHFFIHVFQLRISFADHLITDHDERIKIFVVQDFSEISCFSGSFSGG